MSFQGLCQYANMLGECGQGIHSIRILDIAIVDVFVVLLIAHILSRIFHRISYKIFLAVLVVVGVAAHRLFCVRTGLDRMLFD